MTEQENKKSADFFQNFKKFMHDNIYINKVPSYGNTIFYSFGIILITSFIILAISGVIMIFFGQSWWLTSFFGIYTRSVHMWAAQALLLFLFLHLFVTFATSAFKKKKLVWVIGGIMLLLFTIQAELGYTIRGDFSSQWRALAGADFWNANYLGAIFHTLNYGQVFNVHVIIIPLFLLALIALHYGIVKAKGISKPYRRNVKYKMVEANHKVLYLRAGIVTGAILLLGLFVQSPFIPVVTVQQVSQQQPNVFAQTLVGEFNHTSGTATYMKSIDPYKYNTRTVYIAKPYTAYLAVNPGRNELVLFNSESSAMQTKSINEAYDYFSNNKSIDLENGNHLVSVISSLVMLGRSGLYDAQMKNDLQGDNPTYLYRLLSDTGYLNKKADKLGLSMMDYGALKDEKGEGIWPPNSWWMAPFEILGNTLLKNDPQGAKHEGESLGLFILILATLPWIPYVNRIPEWFGLYKLFWRTEKNRKRKRNRKRK